jgi:hypothetical protein
VTCDVRRATCVVAMAFAHISFDFRNCFYENCYFSSSHSALDDRFVYAGGLLSNCGGCAADGTDEGKWTCWRKEGKKLLPVACKSR